LRERNYRLLFGATTVTAVGDAVGAIALAFAVLELGSATDLGIALAVRQGAQAVVLLAGGVLADRLPRQLVLTGASLVQALGQAGTAAFVLGGAAELWPILVCQSVYGVGAAVIVPAEVGLVPQTVSAERLQQANALQGLSRNATRIVGPAVGGALVVAASPGVALAADAISFALCAVLLSRIRVPAPPRTRVGFVRELREGWEELTAQTWIWAAVGLFGLSNMFYVGCWTVLGPAVAEAELGGAGPWASILAAGGVGAVAGGTIALRYRPGRPLVACVLAPLPMVLPLVGLALVLPVPVIAVLTLLSSMGLALHLTLWLTVFQQRVPEHAQSRVSAYDTLGSFVLVPVGMAFAGPLAGAIGVAASMWLAVGVFLGAAAVILAIPSVRAIRSPEQTMASVERAAA
jgi:MFS family permease